MDPGGRFVVEVGAGADGPRRGQLAETEALLRASRRDRCGLAQLQHFDVSGGAAVVNLELGDELVLGCDDRRSAP